MRLIRVAVPVPALDALTYRVPDEFSDPVVGARVLVPLGNRTLTGVVIETGLGVGDPGSGDADVSVDAIKPVLDVLDDEPFLPADVVRLASWAADYYAAGAGEAMAAAMPPRAWIESDRYAQITELGEVRLLTERGVRRAILDALSGGKPSRTGSIIGGASGSRGVHGVLLALERDHLVQLTRPLKGTASAYRTVRVATLTAQGHDLVEPPPGAALKGCATSEYFSTPRSAGLQPCPDQSEYSSIPRSAGLQPCSDQSEYSSIPRSAGLQPCPDQSEYSSIPRSAGLQPCADQAALKGCATEGDVGAGAALKDGATGEYFSTPRSAGLQPCPDQAPVKGCATDEENDGGASRLKLGARQREALELLAGAPDGLDTSTLAGRRIGAATLKRLTALGLVAISRRRIDRDPFVGGASTPPRPAVQLTAEQAAAFETLRALAATAAFSTVLLHGVTGSGKTELYLRLADEVRRSGRGVLLLVPEIALTPAIAAIFRSTFGERVAIQHSGLSDGERHDQWQRIRRGDIDVVVGTRSAVFAPLRSIGLIIVDEEHDGSYKQEESPRYHGRDVAVVRGSQAGALVVLGSATPSLETYHNAQNGRYTRIALEKRVLDRPMAAVRIVDMREEFAASGPDVILSAPLCEGLADRLQRKEQAIVLLNRRGFASAVFCRQCASTLECPNCSVSLTVHRAANRARCHYCNYMRPIPKTCANCAGPYLEQIGFGTERVEAEIVEKLPGARVARVDRDTIRKRGAIAGLLSRFANGELDVLVGTQMIAKGHDFPRVTLVGVVSADVGLGLADFRAAERTFQLLTQVAGRSGRGEIRGEAIVQTLYPHHYSIQHACRQDYAAFYEEEIAFRRGMRYPPALAMINVVVKARTREGAMQDASEIVAALRWGGEPYRVLGPAPAPLQRLKGEHRAQLFIKGGNRAAMRKALLAVLAARPEIRRRTIVDVDPMAML